MAAIVSENYQLKWHSYGAHLHSSVATSLNSDAFTDVSLCTMDGHQINAHRFVLATCSQYLQQVFRTHAKSAPLYPLMVVLPPEITYKTLKTLIQYMYCGETTVSNDILESVLRGGDILQVRGLWRPRTPTNPPNNPSASAPNPMHRTPVKVVPNKTPPQIDTKALSANGSELRKQQVVGKEETDKADVVPGNGPQPPEKIVPEEKKDADYLVIKEEPLEWNEFQEEMNETEMFHTEMTIKPEIIFPAEDSSGEIRAEGEEMYSPLTCELCSETYTLPGEWVRHIRTHTDMQPAKRRRGGRTLVEDDDNFPPLQCDLCQKQFPTPGEWVRHIQNTHTDTELADANNGAQGGGGGGGVAGCGPQRTTRGGVTRSGGGGGGVGVSPGLTHKTCTICNKKFPSHASMLIHRRTHTGERPFVCDFCQKGFNVKSNLLRHLRTLHDKIINSADVAPEGKTE